MAWCPRQQLRCIYNINNSRHQHVANASITPKAQTALLAPWRQFLMASYQVSGSREVMLVRGFRFSPFHCSGQRTLSYQTLWSLIRCLSMPTSTLWDGLISPIFQKKRCLGWGWRGSLPQCLSKSLSWVWLGFRLRPVCLRGLHLLCVFVFSTIVF